MKSNALTIIFLASQELCYNFSHLQEAAQSSHVGNHQGSNLLQCIKVELEKHKDQQKRVSAYLC